MKINIILLLLILLLFPILSVNGQNKYTVEPGVKNNQIVLQLVNTSKSETASLPKPLLRRGLKNLSFRETSDEMIILAPNEEKEITYTFDVNYNIVNIEADTVEFLITDNKTIHLTKQFIFTYTQPKEFRLEQNYPNPFNPSTKIRYTIPMNPPLSPFTKGGSGESRGGFVTLKVYDILGNEVATLVNEEKPAGYYEVEFNAGRIASGVYIYRLTSEKFVSTKKMMVVK